MSPVHSGGLVNWRSEKGYYYLIGCQLEADWK